MARHFARFFGLFVGLVVALASHDVWADELSSARGQPLAEVSHTVDLRIDNGLAIYTVRRTFANTGTQADEVRLSIDLPAGAAATGLKIRARKRWYDAQLLPREEAADKYQELTGVGSWAAKDPALLQWNWSDNLLLRIFPVFPNGVSTVEYTLTAPLLYDHGYYIASYPYRDWNGASSPNALPLARPILRVDPGHGDATTRVKIDGKPVAPQMPVVLERVEWSGEDEIENFNDDDLAISNIGVLEKGIATMASVDLDLSHTYRDELQIDLVTPSGKRIHLDFPPDPGNSLRDSLVVALPAKTQAHGNWSLEVYDNEVLDIGTLRAWSLQLSRNGKFDAPGFRKVAATDLPLFIPDGPSRSEDEVEQVRIEIEPAPMRQVTARLGRVPVSDEVNFLRLQVDAAPEFSALPVKPAVVFVVDASYSANPVIDSKPLIEDYLSYIPDARVELVVFRRDADAIAGSLLPVEDFWRAYDKAQADGRFGPGNGSALELGLAKAVATLRNAGRRPKRIVLLTDALLRSRFKNVDAFATFRRSPTDMIAHLVVFDDQSSAEEALQRNDDHVLAPIAVRTGGVLYTFSPQELQMKGLHLAVKNLVRPSQVDDFRISGLDANDLADLDVPSVLREGSQFGFMLDLENAPRTITLEGKIWTQPFRRTVAATRGFSSATAAFVFSEDLYDQLEEDEMMKVALQGRVVSPVTSYLAIEPGVRPSTIGFEDGGGGTGEGTIGLDSTGLIGRGQGNELKQWTIGELMARDVAACADRYKPQPGWTVELEVETTLQEIVDVQTTSTSELASCIVEAAWDVAPTWNFSQQRESHIVQLHD